MAAMNKKLARLEEQGDGALQQKIDMMSRQIAKMTEDSDASSRFTREDKSFLLARSKSMQRDFERRLGQVERSSSRAFASLQNKIKSSHRLQR